MKIFREGLVYVSCVVFREWSRAFSSECPGDRAGLMQAMDEQENNKKQVIFREKENESKSVGEAQMRILPDHQTSR